MDKIFTPHINAKKDDFAKTVLMPGDPLRSKYIAENFLENAVLVNNVRGVQGYTGTYKNKKVSVMASGMGMPSIAIYSYELFKFFDVENIIRIGSAGAIQDEINLRDIVIGMSASTDSNIVEKFGTPGVISPTADYELLEKCVEKAKEEKLNIHIGNILSSDLFYSFEDYLREEEQSFARWKDMGVLADYIDQMGNIVKDNDKLEEEFNIFKFFFIISMIKNFIFSLKSSISIVIYIHKIIKQFFFYLLPRYFPPK